MGILTPSFPAMYTRPMQEGDIKRVHAIDRASFPVPWPAGSYLYEVRDNDASICLVAETELEDGHHEVVGMVVVWMIVDEAHIATFAVDPRYRRNGIGRLLLEDALREAIKQGATSSTLEVRAGNIPAQALYRAFGFDVVGRRHAYYKDNSEDAILMSVYDLNQDYLNWLLDELGDNLET
jgi:[ribosomal protein S18]-alanine N-acetyltransferase